jgi:hypothetical protein
LACIVTAECLIGQQSPFAPGDRDFFFSKDVYRFLSRGVYRLTAPSLLSILSVALLETLNDAPVR